MEIESGLYSPEIETMEVESGLYSPEIETLLVTLHKLENDSFINFETLKFFNLLSGLLL